MLLLEYLNYDILKRKKIDFLPSVASSNPSTNQQSPSPLAIMETKYPRIALKQESSCNSNLKTGTEYQQILPLRAVE